MIYFTSDTHFSHKNIIKYCNRPFQSAFDMNELLVSNWNATVKPNDTVFHLGDVGCWYGDLDWINFLGKLNGRKLLIAGNHDKKLLDKLEFYFEVSTHDILEIPFEDDEGKCKFVLCHYPIYEWPGKSHGAIHCYGHTHKTVDKLGITAVHVGVDTNDFTPISASDVALKAAQNNLRNL